jgi:hypothetical protein
MLALARHQCLRIKVPDDRECKWDSSRASTACELAASRAGSGQVRSGQDQEQRQGAGCNDAVCITESRRRDNCRNSKLLEYPEQKQDRNTVV